MTALREIIAAEANRDTFPAARAFGEELRRRYGPSTAGVIFYGSCLRQNTDVGLLLDFYVLVDSYARALKHPVSAVFARLLPPNVYYHEMTFEDRPSEKRIVRAKVAVMAVGQFLHGVGPETFASSLWARFAQPAMILYARNNEVRRRLVDGLASAVETMILRTQPLMDSGFTARDLWVRAFTNTYGAELRPEKDSKAGELVDMDLERYVAVTSAVLGSSFPGSVYHHAPADKQRAVVAWRLRRVQGKMLNVLRLIKAAFTFQGGLDYAVWKIERHSGVKVELTEAERKRPLITGARLLLKTMSRGGLR
ncbi:MAG: hypothetical protein K2P94_02400 [Rhodospirillaceae bacterium]|nr:hypothetical protein [Rhodospirillaceae bacterium]